MQTAPPLTKEADPDGGSRVVVATRERIADHDALLAAPAPRPSSRRRLLPWALPAAITLSWFVFVTASGHWGRVIDQFRSSITMVFGSFVAGSTPQGGGAVAFPVFTKVLEVPPPVARTFSLSIQAVGMTVASIVILLKGRRIIPRAVAVGGAAGVAGFLGALFLIGDSATTFWVSTIPGPYVKVTFTVILAAMAYTVYLSRRSGRVAREEFTWNARTTTAVALGGAVGGVASALTGSGADVFVFLVVVVIAGMATKVGVPTSVITMAVVSVVGFVVLGLIDGQIATSVTDGQVVAVGGQAIEPLPATQFDVFGLWIAAIPIVVWGAPLGTMFAAWLSEHRLVAFVTGMAIVETVTTVLFLDALHSNRALLVYAVGALLGMMLLVRALAANGSKLLRLPAHARAG